MEVSFENLSCTAPLSKKLLLDNVSGRFSPGELTAILGPSGAGKTTLLKAISGYGRKGVKGQIQAGQQRHRCYISQEDTLAQFLTAGELIGFASRLKLPVHYTAKQRAAVVEELMLSLGLEGCSDTRTECLSGGQKKRLAIALELISNPSHVFLDEPTSGLDIVTAGLLIQLLHKLSHQGRTIIVTIHQPSASIFKLFDRVYFLAQGKCIYQGPSSHLVQFLAQHNFLCPRHYSPADYLIELCENRRYIDALCEASANGAKSWYSTEADKQISKSLTTCTIEHSTPGSEFLGERTVCCSSTWNQFCVLLSRTHLQTKRNWVGLMIQLVHYVICGICIGSLFYNKANDGSEFRANANFCYSVIVFHTYTTQMTPAINYPPEVELLKREHFNQWHSLLPYYLSFRISKIPYVVFLVLIFSLIVYTLSGLPWEVGRFCLFYAVGVMISLSAESLGLTMGTLFSVTNASIIGSMSMFPLLGLASYGVDYMRDLPVFMEYIAKTSFIRQGFLSLIIIMYGLDRKTMDCPEEKEFCFFSSPFTNLYFMNLEKIPVWYPLMELFIITCFFWLTFYLALKWRLRH